MVLACDTILTVIRKLIHEKHNVTVISNGRSLEVLTKTGRGATYVDIPDYPMLISENTGSFLQEYGLLAGFIKE